MFNHSKLSFKLSVSIIILILLVETMLLFISYEKKHDQLLSMQKYEKSLYGQNLIYSKLYIDNELNTYVKNIVLLSLLISFLVSVGFILIYHRFVGSYIIKISKLNNETSPLKTKEAFLKVPNDEIGSLILSRVKMLSRLEEEIGRNKKLLRILSHDLSNLLMISVGNISILKKMLNPEDNSKIQRIINKIEFSGLRQKELINSVRELDANKDRLDSATIKIYDIKDLVSESILIFEERLLEKNIKVKWNTEMTGKLNVLVDRILFVNNVLNNILSNAIKFSQINSEIILDACMDNERNVFLKVSDFGVGIPKQMLENLFEGGVSISREGVIGEKGTGFGMGLMKGTLERFEGEINVESREMTDDSVGHGTTITIKLKNNVQTEVV